jgi:hypothetical protein
MAIREQIERLVRAVRPYPVKKIYKYRHIESPALDRVFANQQIYLTDATKFNDPFESRPLPRVDQSPEIRTRFAMKLAKLQFPRAEDDHIRRLADEKVHLLKDREFLRMIHDEMIRTTGIYCLTEKNDDLLMWALYSDSHKGLCLEFDPTDYGTLFWGAGKSETSHFG